MSKHSAHYDWSRAPRRLLEEHAHESRLYWETPGRPKPPSCAAVCHTLDELCKAARRLRSRDEIKTEVFELAQQLATLPRPFDLDESSRLRTRMNECCAEPFAEASPQEDDRPQRYSLTLGAVEHRLTLEEIRELLAGAGLGVVEHGKCSSCVDLRARLRNVYHLTLNGQSGDGDGPTLQAIREASGPGAPAAPAPRPRDAGALRTRAEVDAEIEREVRYYYAMMPPGIGPTPAGLISTLNRLCAEPTAEGTDA